MKFTLALLFAAAFLVAASQAGCDDKPPVTCCHCCKPGEFACFGTCRTDRQTCAPWDSCDHCDVDTDCIDRSHPQCYDNPPCEDTSGDCECPDHIHTGIVSAIRTKLCDEVCEVPPTCAGGFCLLSAPFFFLEKACFKKCMKECNRECECGKKPDDSQRLEACCGAVTGFVPAGEKKCCFGSLDDCLTE
ncbi:unnamed protein product [Vitrella brassicaformis CCMP3155]|uniref:Uncharacterized protein n=2 Tax=Vitrella brassicaformis TaxID=1169539 RepID=A0A0G4GNT0_VITBC|nr:unnamed protein product [Vitrella brassicaformis CCMP3155]|mmetsp:Transcript_37/g.131  ORF Transcript_37/g.131 Transcript_37/m.131 type:complete len:189 (+) Transcript_37:201-767(+)|eukprot:CEM31941.1 unnamed protein product [Vitrella brassicaformis CCMP3155]